jgi:hypothetical protein
LIVPADAGWNISQYYDMLRLFGEPEDLLAEITAQWFCYFFRLALSKISINLCNDVSQRAAANHPFCRPKSRCNGI